MPSLKNIAAELGISHTLVSKVLSGRMGTTGVSPATREAILRKAKELDYSPNRLAVALKSGRKGAVGVFLHSMGVPGSDITVNFLSGISQVLAGSGLRLWLRFFHEDDEFLAACDDKLRRDVDGLIVGGVDHPGLIRRLQEIDEKSLPVVSSFSERVHPALESNVRLDYEMQGYLTTRHLLERGCRRLAHFRTFDLRHEGFLRAHREAGVEPVPALLIATDSFYVPDGLDAVRRLLETGEPFDGIVACSDTQAAAAMRVLLERGIPVPGRVRLTGIDDSPLVHALQVPLTSVTAEMEECGRLAAQMLLDRLEGVPAAPKQVVPRLMVRASSD